LKISPKDSLIDSLHGKFSSKLNLENVCAVDFYEHSDAWQNRGPQKSPVSPQKSPVSPQKSPVSPQKSPVSPQKSHVSPQKSPVSPQKSPVLPQALCRL